MKEFDDYRLKYFHDTYDDKVICKKPKFKIIVQTFFEILITEILSGNVVKLPYLGFFKTIQKKATKKSIDHHLTRINKQNGVEQPVVYRTNPYYYAFQWDRNLSMANKNYHPKSAFLFNASSGNQRKIPAFHDILEMTHA